MTYICFCQASEDPALPRLPISKFGSYGFLDHPSDANTGCLTELVWFPYCSLRRHRREVISDVSSWLTGLHFPTVTPCWWFEINCSRSVYTVEIGKGYISGSSSQPHPELTSKTLPAQGLPNYCGASLISHLDFYFWPLASKTIHARVQIF